MKKTATINELIPLFHLTHETLMSGFAPALATRITNDREIVMNMTQRVAEFWNEVWDQWKESFQS